MCFLLSLMEERRGVREFKASFWWAFGCYEIAGCVVIVLGVGIWRI